MSVLKMPDRQPADGEVSVGRLADGSVSITVSNDCVLARIVMSEYNAWRILGMLSMLLGLKLSPRAMKLIKL